MLLLLLSLLCLHQKRLLLQGASSPTSEIAAHAKAAALAVSSGVQAAGESATIAVSSQETNPSFSQTAPQPDSDAQRSAVSDPSVSPSSSSTAANGSAPERAKHALMKRIAMVTDGYRENDCTCFDTTLGCTLEVRPSPQAHTAVCFFPAKEMMRLGQVQYPMQRNAVQLVRQNLRNLNYDLGCLAL